MRDSPHHRGYGSGCTMQSSPRPKDWDANRPLTSVRAKTRIQPATELQNDRSIASNRQGFTRLSTQAFA
jgi:hypothetical protein